MDAIIRGDNILNKVAKNDTRGGQQLIGDFKAVTMPRAGHHEA